MEEDIKLIEHYMEYYSKDYIFRKAIENLIKGYKELEEENRNIKNHIYYKEVVELNYIPKSKVREKIEELKQTSYYTEGEAITVEQVEILEELLQEGDK